MGEVIELKDQLADRSRPRGDSRVAFFYDVACPFSYLVAEGVERVLGEVEWMPAPAGGLDGGARRTRFEDAREAPEPRAEDMPLPLVCPDTFPANPRHALRAASHPAERGPGANFALAPTRLAFCGGFDLEDPEILAVAASAAGLSIPGCLTAARGPSRDHTLWATARGLRAGGLRGRAAAAGGPARPALARGRAPPRERRAAARTRSLSRHAARHPVLACRPWRRSGLPTPTPQPPRRPGWAKPFTAGG